MRSAPLLSSDSHVIEPPDLWTGRIEARFRDRAPRVVAVDGADWWEVDGRRLNSFQGGAQTGKRFDDPAGLRGAARFDEVRPGSYQPAAHLADNETDGVLGSVLYPTLGLLLYRVRDGALLSALCRVYNDWLVEFCRHCPGRLKGVAMLNVDDVDEAVHELERARRLGLAGGLIPVAPPADRSYDGAGYESLWAAAADLDAPLSLHIGTNRTPEEFRRTKPAVLAASDCWVRASLGHLILSGACERHPRLRIGSVEHDLGWVPYFLDRLDYTYAQGFRRAGGIRFREGAQPRDYFRRNVFVSFQEDALGIRERDAIGVETLVWGSDYPHTESTFPRSRAIVDRMLAGVPDGERALILHETVTRLYAFDLS